MSKGGVRLLQRSGCGISGACLMTCKAHAKWIIVTIFEDAYRQPECEPPWSKRALFRWGVFYFAPEPICLLAAVAWCEAVRPHQGYASKQKKEQPGSWQVKRPLQTGSCLTSVWGFAGVQCVLVGHPTWPGMLGPTRTEWFPVGLVLFFF